MKKIIISIYPSVRNKIFQIYLSDLTGSTQGVSSLRKGVWCMKTSSFSSSSVLIHTGKVSIFVWKKKHFAQVFTGQQGGELKIVVHVNFLLLFLFKWNQLHIFFTIRFSNFKNIYSFSLLRNKSKIINMIKSYFQETCKIDNVTVLATLSLNIAYDISKFSAINIVK